LFELVDIRRSVRGSIRRGIRFRHGEHVFDNGEIQRRWLWLVVADMAVCLKKGRPGGGGLRDMIRLRAYRKAPTRFGSGRLVVGDDGDRY